MADSFASPALHCRDSLRNCSSIVTSLCLSMVSWYVCTLGAAVLVIAGCPTAAACTHAESISAVSGRRQEK
eukprot:scaffold80989_cov37-Tisochrysis_lutea.AAC.2